MKNEDVTDFGKLPHLCMMDTNFYVQKVDYRLIHTTLDQISEELTKTMAYMMNLYDGRKSEE